MQGTYEIIIENKKIRYMFTIRRNLTIIRGDSATGKTTLIDMVREYAESGADSGITLSCSCPCVVLEGVNWRSVLPNYQNSIVFIMYPPFFVVWSPLQHFLWSVLLYHFLWFATTLRVVIPITNFVVSL